MGAEGRVTGKWRLISPCVRSDMDGLGSIGSRIDNGLKTLCCVEPTAGLLPNSLLFGILVGLELSLSVMEESGLLYSGANDGRLGRLWIVWF